MGLNIPGLWSLSSVLSLTGLTSPVVFLGSREQNPLAKRLALKELLPFIHSQQSSSELPLRPPGQREGPASLTLWEEQDTQLDARGWL